MLKKLLISVLVFIIAVTILLVYTDDAQMDTLSNRTLHSSTSINTNELLEISSVFRNNESYNLSEAELDGYVVGKVRVLESSKLTNTIEIYTLDVYQDITESALIELNGNTIIITSDLGPLSFYKGSTFLTLGQFDSNYFDRVPNRMYEIHIPEGTQYILD